MKLMLRNRSKKMKHTEHVKRIENRSRLPPAVDYQSYSLSSREMAEHILECALFVMLVSWLFYDSCVTFAFVAPYAALTLKRKKEKLCARRRRQLETEFKETILIVSSNIQAGYSIENAFKEAQQEIAALFGKGSLMLAELRLMVRRLDNNEQLEDILKDLAKRSGADDIRDFADIFQIAKRSGGNMRGVIANTASIISGKQEVRREIETVVSEKKLEQKIMRYIPFIIMVYISLTSEHYFEGLYHNILGWSVMTAGLAVYFAACRLADKILEINI